MLASAVTAIAALTAEQGVVGAEECSGESGGDIGCPSFIWGVKALCTMAAEG